MTKHYLYLAAEIEACVEKFIAENSVITKSLIKLDG